MNALTQDVVALRPNDLVQGLAGLMARFEALFDAAREGLTVDVAGSRFCIRSDLGDYLRLAERAIASGGRHDGPGARLAVGVAGQAGWPGLRWGASHFNEREVEAILTPTRYRLHYLHDLGFWQVFDRQRATGVQILRSAQGYPDWDPGSPLRNLMQWHLAGTGGAFLHAGTLGIGGRGVLLAGAGGSGKSGTVLTGVLHGLQTVGDDYVFVRPEALTAEPVFDTLKQDAAGVRRLGLGDHPALPAQTNWQGKHQMFLRELSPEARAGTLSLCALLIPSVTGAAITTITPLSAKEAFLALAPSGVSQIPGDRALIYASAAEVARRLPCFRLRLGTDPAEVAAVLRGFIEKMPR